MVQYRHRSVLFGQILKRTMAIAIAASCTFAYNFYLLFVLQYIGSKIIPKIVAHRRLAEGLNIAKRRNTAIMVSGQNNQE